MRLKKFAKTLLIVASLLAAVGFLAFTTFVYNPLEGTVSDVRKAVPRNVDLYVAKEDLSGDFVEFPEPVVWGKITEAPAWSRLSSGRFFKARAAETQPVLAEIRQLQHQLARIPVVRVGILGDLVGQDLILAGKLRAGGVGFDLCAYSRVSWKVRAAIGLLRYEGVRGNLAGVRIALEEDLYRIEAQGAETTWLTRVKDLAIVGNSKELVTESRDLALGRSDKDSIFDAADYEDQVLSPLADWKSQTGVDPNAVHAMVDVAMVRRWQPQFETWPGRPSDVSRELRLVKLFVNQPAMRSIWGSVVFEPDDALTLLAQLNVNHGELTDFQKGFHNEKPAELDRWVRPFLQHMPQKAAIAAALRIPAGAFLDEIFHVLERDAQDLIDEGLRNSGVRGGVRSLIDKVTPGLEPWVGILFRDNDYPTWDLEFKVAIPSPAPAWALVFRSATGEAQRIEQLIELFKTRLRFNMGFDGKDFVSSAGPNKEVKIQEWANPHIEGTGQIALFHDGEGPWRFFIVSNSGKLLTEMVNARYRTGGARGLGAVPEVAQALDEIPQILSGFAWVQGEECRNILARYQESARRRAAEDVADPGWALSLRPQVEEDVFRQHFSGRYSSRDQAKRGDPQRFDELVNTRLQALWARERSRIGDDLESKFNQAASWLDYMHAACVTLRTRPKDLRAQARVLFRF